VGGLRHRHVHSGLDVHFRKTTKINGIIGSLTIKVNSNRHQLKIRDFYRQNRFFCIFLLAWLLLFSLLRTAQHFSFATNACDLSLYDYAISGTLMGQPMTVPFQGWSSLLAIHFAPVLFLLVPLYLVFKGPLFLLYLQVLAVGLASIPLYLLAREKLSGKYPALVVATTYLLFRPLLNGLMYDFHPEMFFPLFIFSGHYFLTIRKNVFLFFVFILLALFIKEDFAIYVFFYCLWLLRSAEPEQKKIGIAAAMVSALYALLVFIFFIPHFRSQIHAPSAYEFVNKWQDYGSTVTQIIGQCLAHPLRFLSDLKLPAHIAGLANYFLPLMLIPLFDPAVLLILPPLFIGWLSRIPLMGSFGLYYGAALLPFLFLAMLQALTRLKKRTIADPPRDKVKWVWILNLLLIFSLVNFKWNLLVPAHYRNIREYPAVRKCLEMIPEQASLAAQSALIPHIPKRKSIFMLPATGGAEYILLHLQLNPWPMQTAQLQALDARLQGSAEYRCLFRSGNLHLFKKNGLDARPRPPLKLE
jgi:uncharacterized membrane protein